jgi:hypothetical protein
MVFCKSSATAQCVFLLVLCVPLAAAEEPWAWTYVTHFDQADRALHAKLNERTITQTGLEPFTQLIFSWNAYRPAKGYFSFWVQGQDSVTGAWSSWHKMMVWGKRLQKSFLSKADTIAQHVHVRFEAHKNKKLSGFRIQIKAHKGASLSAMRSVTAACSDFTKFKSEDVGSLTDLSTIRVRGVPRRSQFLLNHPENHRLCSPTSCTMLVESVAKKKCNPLSFVRNVYDSGLDAYGSWPFNTVHAFEQSNGKYVYRVMRYNSFHDLHERLIKGFPVVVSVRGSIPGAPKSYDSGHLLIVVGFDAAAQKVICHDPAFERDSMTLRFYPLRSFLAAWEASRRLAYHAEHSL